MPVISIFYGIKVTMYYDEHNPPHFHAEYNGKKACINIKNASLISGELPNKQFNMICEWCVIHQEELKINWELTKEGKKINKIEPLM